MEIFYITSFVLLTLVCATGTGWLAKKIGKSCRLWFWLSVPMPVVSICILICLPEELPGNDKDSTLGEHEQLQDQLIIKEDSKPINVYETHFSATA